MITLHELADDGSALAELTRRVWLDAYGGTMWFPLWDADFCRWQFAPENRALHLGAYDGARLVGSFCAVPHVLRAYGARIPISLSGWCTVDPAYAVHGLSGRMTEELGRRHAAAGLAFSLAIVSGDPQSIAHRAWAQYARFYPQRLRFLFPIGYWAKLLAPGAVAHAAPTRAERWGARLFGPLIAASLGDPGRWRPYAHGDLDACAALVARVAEGIDWAIEWPRDQLGRQLGGAGACTQVAEGRNGIVAVASIARMGFHGHAAVRGGVLDVWAAPAAGPVAQALLLGGLCRRLRRDGVELLLAQRAATAPAVPFAGAGFLPLPQRDYLIALWQEDRLPPLPSTWSLLFR